MIVWVVGSIRFEAGVLVLCPIDINSRTIARQYYHYDGARD